ncbi:MAG: sodium:proton antiporter [Clostridiales Family XIII bacterium]|jgi:Na+/H+ antiporter NhaC|nr:sodium:proton antiporter [Clostridiales Family XIII bacterium]
MDYGIISLLPIVCIIVMAVVTRRGIEALAFGVIVCYIILEGFDFFFVMLDDLIAAMGDYDALWLLLLCVFLGSLSILLERSGSVHGLARALGRFANSPKKSMFAAYLAGIVVFFDDYLNIFVVGSLMKKVTDKNKVPREMLAYIVDSTAAPVCLLIPLSSWFVFFSVIFGEQPELEQFGSGQGVYLQSIPFIFYAWATVIVVPLVIAGAIPKFKPMRKAVERARSGQLMSPESAKLAINQEGKTANKNQGNPWDFALPVLAVIVLSIVTGDVLVGLIAGNVVCFVLYWPRKKMKFSVFFDNALDGFASATPLVVICVISVFARTGFSKLGISDYVISVAEPYLSPNLFPAISFVIVAALAFVTVSCWGIVSISIPILIPIAVAVGADPIITAGAILSGSGFGSHTCPYEDASVLTSQVTGISYIEHFATQAPFAGIGAALSVAGYVVCGYIF